MVVIRIDILTQECDLSETLISEISDFVLDGVRWAAPFSSTSKRDDTERAHVVTPSHN
jgi:hypothetical protein